MGPFLTDPNRRGLLVILAFLVALALVVLFAKALAADPPTETDGEQEATSQAVGHVGRIMLAFADGYPAHPAHRGDYRSRFSECIVAAAEKEDLEITWVTTIVQRESSFKTSVRPGFSAGEIGVMQVHPWTARRFKCEMKTVQGQLDCGCSVLRYGLDKCGDIAGALSVYASRSGTCNPKPGSKLEDVVESRLKLIEKHKGL